MNKKMLIGGSALITVAGVGVVGAILGGYSLYEKRKSNLEDLKKKKELSEQNSFATSQVYKVSLNKEYSIFSTTTAKMVFDLPKEFENSTLVLKYTKRLKEEDKAKNVTFPAESVTQFVSKNVRAIFMLTNLSDNYVYDYEISIGEKVYNKGSFLSQLTPTSTAQSAYKGADLTVSQLGSFPGRTLMVKVVASSAFVPSKAEEQFRNTTLLQLFDIPPTEVESGDITTKVAFRPVGIDNGMEYRYVIFDNEGLVPLTSLKSPASFKTLDANIQLTELYGYYKNGSVKLANVADFAGTTLRVGYHKVANESGLFLPRSAKWVDVPVGANDKDIIVNIPNLEPNTMYKVNVYPDFDKSFRDALFKGERGQASSEYKFSTNDQPVANPIVGTKPNPMLEARAARVLVEKLEGYTANSLKVKVVKKPASGTSVDWTNALLGTVFSAKQNIPAVAAQPEATPAVEGSPEVNYWYSDLVGLEPNTDYVWQVIGGDDRTELLATAATFKTIPGFTSDGVKADVPLSKDGQTKVTFKFSQEQLKQFYNNSDVQVWTGTSAPTPAPTDQLVIYYSQVESADTETPANFWSAGLAATAPTVKAEKLTVTLTDGVYKLEDKEITLEAGKVYKATIFYASNKLAPVSDVLTFEMNTQITSESVGLESKVLISLETLKTYKGQELTVTLHKGADASSAAVATQKFTVGDSLVESLEFKDLEPSTEYTYKVTVPSDQVATPPADSTTPPTPAPAFELLNAKVTTASTKIEGRVPAEYINPTSVLFKLMNLNPLQNKEASIAYRKKTDPASEWQYFDLGKVTLNTLEKTILESQPGLDANTEYEFNVVWNKGQKFPILEQSVPTKTKEFVTIAQSNLAQTSVKLTYGNFKTFPNQKLVLKYWLTSETVITNETKSYISSTHATGTQMVSVPANVTDATTLFSSLTSLMPNSRYAYQLFNGNVPVSDMSLFATQTQTSVVSTESFASGFRVSLKDLNTVTGDGADKLVMRVEEQGVSASETAQVLTFKFDKTSDTQDLVAYGLKTTKKYVFQIFKQSDTTFTNPIITTNATSDKRTVTLLANGEIPTLKVEQRAATSALLEFDNLAKFIGKKLVINYKESYWDATTSKEVEVQKSVTTTVDANKMPYQLLGLKPKTKYHYEVFVEVNGTTDKITLLVEKAPEATREEFTTGGTDLTNKSGANFIETRDAKLVFVNGLSYKGVKLVLKAVPKTTTPDWSASTVISSEAKKVGFGADGSATANFNDASEETFKLSGLNPKTEYVYQLFAEGLEEPLLKEVGTFATKGLIKMEVTEVHPTRMRLLLSNLDTYVGQKLKVKYRPVTATGGTAASWNEIQTTVSGVGDGGKPFGPESVLPIPLTGLLANTNYEFQVVAIENATTDSTTNLLENTSLTKETLPKGVKMVYVPSTDATKVQATLYNIAKLNGGTFKLRWREKTATNYKNEDAVTFTLPADTSTTSYVVPNDLALDKTKEYTLSLLPLYPEYSYIDGHSADDELLDTTYGSTLKAANIQITMNAKSTFSDQSATKASTLTTKAKIEEKFDLPTATELTIELKDNVEGGKQYITANDAEGKLFVTVIVKNKDTATDPAVPGVEHVIELSGFQKDTAPAVPANPTPSP